MSSDEADKKNVEDNTQDATSSAEESTEKEDTKEEKVNSKPAAKKKNADPPKIKQPAKKRVKSEQAEKETKKEDKKEEKKKVEEEDEEDDESADENDVENQNHKAVPLLDQPLEITGSRKRKEVQRFKPTAPEEETKEVKIPEGKGKALGDIERIDFNIQRAKPEDLKLLHRICFGKRGKASNVKKFIKKFKGFEFDNSSDEFEKKKVYFEKNLKKVTVAQLKNICNIVDIEKGGTKDDILERILKFLACPVDSGKKLPGGGRSKRSGASAKNYDEGEESFKSKRKSKSKKKDEGSEASEDDDEKDQSDEEEEEVKETENNKKEKAQATEESEPEEEEEEEEEEEKPKKGAKKGKKAVEAADKKAPPKKRAAAKKAVEKKSESEGEAEEESEDDEEPLAKKAKTPPTDEEIKTYVKSLLEGANLELITMKKVCQDVYAHYPDFNLGHKKDFIKTTVKSLISS